MKQQDNSVLLFLLIYRKLFSQYYKAFREDAQLCVGRTKAIRKIFAKLLKFCLTFA